MSKPSVQIVAYSPNPERLVAAAARSCWSNRPFQEIYTSLRERDIDKLLKKVILRGHHSVLEHADFTFALSGISRVLTHQLVRHRIASYSQLSQQRVDQSEVQYIIPPAIRRDPELTRRYQSWVNEARSFYALLVEQGVPQGSARYVLPSACETRVVVSMNARSLFNLIAQRDCASEEWEFRTLAHRMHAELLKVAPRIFRFAGPRCRTETDCLEGELVDECGLPEATGAVVRFRESELQLI